MNEMECTSLEYNNVKQEIFTLMNRIDQLIVVEYTVSISLLGIGCELKNPVFFILPFLFVIPIQEMINTRRRHMVRASVYIEYYIEKKNPNLNWETFIKQVDLKYREKYLKRTVLRKAYWFVTNNGVLIIALISAYLYLNSITVFVISDGYICLNSKYLLQLIMVITGFVILLVQCVFYTGFKDISERYYGIMKDMESVK